VLNALGEKQLPSTTIEATKAARLRYEHKYLVPERLLDRLRRCVEPFMRLDSHVPRSGHSYTVRTIYFDDARFKSYFEKDDGIEVRAKPRIRGYNKYEPGTLVFLEVKRRHGSVGFKDRAAIPYENVATLLSTGDVEQLIQPPSWMPESRSAARKFLFHVYRDALHPVLLECYEREPYVGLLEPSLRVTFDQEIRSSMYPRIGDLFEAEGKHRSFRGWVVLEVKHDASVGFPGWMRRFISEHGAIREALSKYWTCMTDWGGVHSHSRVRALACSEWTRPTSPEGQATHG